MWITLLLQNLRLRFSERRRGEPMLSELGKWLTIARHR